MKNAQQTADCGRSPFAQVAGLMFILFALAACGKDPVQTAQPAAAGTAAAPGAGRPAADRSLVTVPPALVERLKLAAVERRKITEPLSVVGRIDFNEQTVSRIGASVTGRVTQLGGLPGESVRAGDVLAQLHSTELGSAQLAYVKASAQRDLAAKAVDRARLLLSADVIGSAELQRRENELIVAGVEQRAAADQLRVMGMSSAAIEQTMRTGAITSSSSVVSTMSGVIVERKVNKGQVVQPADELFIVADLSRVWVVAKVPESQINLVQPGQSVRIEVSSSPEPLRGRVTWIANTVNAETRTVTVRSEVDNRQRQLRPGMLASVSIEPVAVERLVLPAEAVVREGNNDHVFVRLPDGRFRMTRVVLADETGRLRVVESGVSEGDTVVVEGAFHLNNERKRAELEGA
jgi:cobalt-zinc-cadmium efflux system membrane fusion protein